FTDSAVAKTPEIVKLQPKPTIQPIPHIRNRESELMKSLVVKSPKVTVKLYDNGEIDDDTISVYHNNKLVLSNKRLSAQAIIYTFTIEEDSPEQVLTMVAENLGRIPPNTSLMIVESGGQRFDVRITSNEQKNAVVRFRYEPD